MAAKTELRKAEEFIKTKLSVRSTLAALVGTRLHRRHAQSDTTCPCARWFYYGGAIEYLGDGTPFYADLRYVVTGVDLAKSNTADGLDQIAAEIDLALTNHEEGDIFVVRRVEPYDHAYTISSIDYEERGGIYQLAVNSQ